MSRPSVNRGALTDLNSRPMKTARDVLSIFDSDSDSEDDFDRTLVSKSKKKKKAKKSDTNDEDEQPKKKKTKAEKHSKKHSKKKKEGEDKPSKKRKAEKDAEDPHETEDDEEEAKSSDEPRAMKKKKAKKSDAELERVRAEREEARQKKREEQKRQRAAAEEASASDTVIKDAHLTSLIKAMFYDCLEVEHDTELVVSPALLDAVRQYLNHALVDDGLLEDAVSRRVDYCEYKTPEERDSESARVQVRGSHIEAAFCAPANLKLLGQTVVAPECLYALFKKHLMPAFEQKVEKSRQARAPQQARQSALAAIKKLEKACAELKDDEASKKQELTDKIAKLQVEAGQWYVRQVEDKVKNQKRLLCGSIETLNKERDGNRPAHHKRLHELLAELDTMKADPNADADKLKNLADVVEIKKSALMKCNDVTIPMLEKRIEARLKKVADCEQELEKAKQELALLQPAATAETISCSVVEEEDVLFEDLVQAEPLFEDLVQAEPLFEDLVQAEPVAMSD